MDFKNDIVQEEQELKKGEKSHGKMVDLKNILPPFNYSAKSPSGIYNIDSLIELKEEVDTSLLLQDIQILNNNECIF